MAILENNFGQLFIKCQSCRYEQVTPMMKPAMVDAESMQEIIDSARKRMEDKGWGVLRLNYQGGSFPDDLCPDCVADFIKR